MGEHARVDWRFRAAAQASAALACIGVFAFMVLVSRTTFTPQHTIAGVEVLLAEESLRQDAPRPSMASSGTATVAAPPNPTIASSVEAEMLQSMLRCFARPDARRPPDCPREATPEYWARPQIPTGGAYARPEQPDMARIYTRAEQQTLVMPSCMRDGPGGMVGACVRMGVTPPPPSRSAEEICRDGGLGGPCAPPPGH